MDFNTELKIKEEINITEEEAYNIMHDFSQDNEDLEGIVKVQMDEVLGYLYSKLRGNE